jgi:hypothetical protein
VSKDRDRIIDVLAALSVRRGPGRDELDSVGLGDHRSSPEHLDRDGLCDELGV